MDAIEVLHNAARHFCIVQAAYWHRQYAELSAARQAGVEGGDWRYSEEAWQIFPRYNVLAAIQSEVERFVPGDFSSADELRSFLAAAAESAQNLFTEIENPVGIRAATDERHRFIEFIRSADVAALAETPLLPFRRVLGIAEHRQLREAFDGRWGVWYGGAVDPAGAAAETVTLHTAGMSEPEYYQALRELLRGRSINRLLELREWGDGYELDTVDASFIYNGAEGFWTARPDTTWMVYASHESSITFGGKWLIDEMRNRLRSFDQYLYRGWSLSAYPVSPQVPPDSPDRSTT